MNDLNDSFLSESEKLEKQINHLLSKSEKLTIDNIVSIYYQIMNINSMLQVLKNEQNNPSETFTKTEALIQEKFNESLHPIILSQLNNSIQEYMINLKQSKKKEKSQDDLQKEAKSYEELRKLMSTKEFVEQYAKGLIK